MSFAVFSFFFFPYLPFIEVRPVCCVDHLREYFMKAFAENAYVHSNIPASTPVEVTVWASKRRFILALIKVGSYWDEAITALRRGGCRSIRVMKTCKHLHHKYCFWSSCRLVFSASATRSIESHASTCHFLRVLIFCCVVIQLEEPRNYARQHGRGRSVRFLRWCGRLCPVLIKIQAELF